MEVLRGSSLLTADINALNSARLIELDVQKAGDTLGLSQDGRCRSTRRGGKVATYSRAALSRSNPESSYYQRPPAEQTPQRQLSSSTPKASHDAISSRRLLEVISVVRTTWIPQGQKDPMPRRQTTTATGPTLIHRPSTTNVDQNAIIANGKKGLRLMSRRRTTALGYPCQLKHMELEDVYIQTYFGTDERHIYPFFVERTFGLGGLESFRIIIMEGLITESLPDFEAAKSLIRSNSASLKVLDVMITSSEPVILPNDEPVFDVSKMPLLEEWTLGGVFYIGGGGGGAEAVLISLSWLSRHLETIPAGKRFKSITIRPRMYQVYNVMDLVWDVESLKYFENLIVEKALPSTKSLSVDFIIVAPFDYEEPVKQLLRKLLPTLYELNLLKFSYD
ncbi:hypothetical protein D9613_008798 [Agrocybe pediades]|uniref:Uncharacterized protein n=1 Tax=Agrocybe pediades TaxID=84607 RepID=A0A8H4QTK5_9AGAR|nr:hypothetical protein D9613_008798 [Agrocybe pediades]